MVDSEAQEPRHVEAHFQAYSTISSHGSTLDMPSESRRGASERLPWLTIPRFLSSRWRCSPSSSTYRGPGPAVPVMGGSGSPKAWSISSLTRKGRRAARSRGGLVRHPGALKDLDLSRGSSVVMSSR